MKNLRTRSRALGTIVAVGLSAGLVSSAAAQWEQWGGPARDFVVDAGSLSTSWPAEGPKQVWTRSLAGGYSCVLAHGGRLYTMARDGEEEQVLALNPETGETIWEHRYPAPIPEGAQLRFGKGPNATPLIMKDQIVTVGFGGHLACLSLKDGKPRWSRELVTEMKGNAQVFGYSSSPLAYKDKVIVAVGGAGQTLVALNMSDGSVAWSAQDFDNSYSSPILIEVDGQQQVVNFCASHVIGVSPEDGSLLWSHPHENQWKTNIVTPIWHGGILYISSGGEAGSRGLKLTRSGGKTEVEELWFTDKMKIGHTNVVRVGDNVFGSSGDRAMFLTSIDLKSGEIGFKERGFAKANLLAADGKLIILDEDGMLALARSSGDKLEVLCQAQVLKNKAWTVPTLIGTRLFVRDTETLAALDLQ